MKPRISLEQYLWGQAVDELSKLGVGGRICFGQEEYRIVTWHNDPPYSWVQVRDKSGNSRMLTGGKLMEAAQ